MARHFLEESPDGTVLIEDPLDRELALLIASNDGGGHWAPSEEVDQAVSAMLDALDRQPVGRHSEDRSEIFTDRTGSATKAWEGRPAARFSSREPRRAKPVRPARQQEIAEPKHPAVAKPVPQDLDLDRALQGLYPVQPPATRRDPAERFTVSVRKPIAFERRVEVAVQVEETEFDLGYWLDLCEPKRIVSRSLLDSLAYSKFARSSLGLVIALGITYATGITEMRAEAPDQAQHLAVDVRKTSTAASRSSESVPTPVLQAIPTSTTSTTSTEAPKPTTTTTTAPAKQYMMPLDGAKKTSTFGMRVDPVTHKRQIHEGMDLAAPTGTPIHAAAGGTVTKAGWTSGYGNYTCIDHGGGKSTCYGHQSKIEVKVGQKVNQGDEIGKVGSTGQSTGPHLHFEVRINGNAVDPSQYF